MSMADEFGGVYTNAKRDNDLKDYMKEVNKIPMLNEDETKNLAKKAQNGDIEARNKLVKHNLRLVISIAKSYKGRGAFPDIVQNGNIGLMRAIETFDPEKGAFSTYATTWIKQAIRKGIVLEENTIYIPQDVYHLKWKIKNTTEKYIYKHGKEPSDKELADILGETEEKVRNTRQQLQNIYSLDVPIEENNDITYVDLIEDRNVNIAQNIEDEDTLNHIKKFLSTLKPREKQVLILRFGLDGHAPRTFQECADIFGVKRQAIQQQEARVLEKIKKKGLAEGLKQFW